MKVVEQEKMCRVVGGVIQKTNKENKKMPEITNFFAHGSRWVRADFHLHTRRDKEFKDTGAEQDFVARYVAALKQADIRVGVITNHNKFDRDEFMALRKAAKQREISIYCLVLSFPSTTERNGIHTLVVFHDDWIDNRENRRTTSMASLELPSAGQTKLRQQQCPLKSRPAGDDP